jgi:cardiolipin synthase
VLWTIFAVVEILWVVGFSAWIILERRSPTATLAWILGMAVLPLVGAVVYAFLGPRRVRRKRLRHALARSRLERDLPACPTCAAPPEDPRLRQLQTLVERSGGTAPLRARGLVLHRSGDACYDAMVAAIGAARHHVHVEYYIWEPDRVGTRLRDALVERARAGVEVRLLLDAIGSHRVGRRFLRPLREAGAQVAFFNDVTLARFRPRLLNFRTHRKIVVCDGALGFTGGVNVSERHSAEHSGPEAWRDTHLQLVGEAVRGLQVAFLEDWIFATDQSVEVRSYLPPDDGQGDHQVQVIASGPDFAHPPLQRVVFAALSAASHRLLVTTPYFVPDEPVLASLTAAALRGVDVRLLLPARGDSRLVAAAARSFYGELLHAGVRVFEYAPTMLHAKTLVVDDDLALVGTANLDSRSLRLNFEVSVLVFGRDVAAELADHFAEDLRRSVEVSRHALSRIPLLRRAGESAARLFAPLL